MRTHSPSGTEPRPQIALLVPGLPGMNGIAQHRSAPAMIIIALTDWREEADRERTAAAGFNDHLSPST